MTNEEIAQVVTYCDKNNVNQKQRFEELGIKLSMTESREFNGNVKAEQINSTIMNELLTFW